MNPNHDRGRKKFSLDKGTARVSANVAPLVFFAVGFNALVVTIDVLSTKDGIVPISHFTACVGALLVSKGILVAQFLPFFDRFADSKRLALIFWKAMLFFLSTSCLHVLERLISARHHAASLESGVASELQTFDLGHFLIVQMWLAILIFSYTTVMEMVRELGHETVLEALLDQANRPGDDQATIQTSTAK